MSTFNEIDIACPECGEQFKGTIWAAVHVKEDPELKELLLGGELNIVQCPECAHVFYYDHFVLYQDPSAELVAYVYPESEAPQAETLRAMMLKSFAEAQDVFPAKQRISYEPLLLFGLETLVEILRQEEERGEQSQIAQVICEQHKIPAVLLRPSRARRLGIMRLLPGAKDEGEASREKILAGVEWLLSLNSALTLYIELRDKIKGDKEWKIDNQITG